MSYEWEGELAALVELSDQEAANTINVMKKTIAKEYRITYRTMLQIMRDPVRLEAARVAIKATISTVDSMLNSYNDAGGLDVQYPESKAYLQSMVGEGDNQLKQNEVDTIVALATQEVAKYSFCTENQVKEVRTK